MKRVDVDDRIDEMGSSMDRHIWFDMDEWFLDAKPALKWAIQAVVVE